MAKGYPRGNARAKAIAQAVTKISVPLRKVQLTTTGLTGVGWGTAVIGGLPQGNLLILGAVGYFKLTTASANVIATFDGDVSVGTDPASSNAAQSGTQANIIATTALGAATAKVSPYVRGISPATIAAVLDNTDGSKELNLNVLIDDASVSADGNLFSIDGELEVAVVVLLDD